MQVPIMGSVSSFVKAMTLENKWQLKKKNFTQLSQEDSQLAAYRKQAADIRKSSYISSIEGKLKAGLALSGAELEYLRANAPELYRKAVEIQKEREDFRKEMERCRTKEDVQKLKTSRMQRYAAQAQSVANNSAIPLEKKLEKLEEINMRAMALQNEHARYTQSAQYASLPDDREDEKRKKSKRKDGINLDGDSVRREIEKLRQQLLEKAKASKEVRQSPDFSDEAASEQAGDSAAQPVPPAPDTGAGAGIIYDERGKPSASYAGASKANEAVPRISVEA